MREKRRETTVFIRNIMTAGVIVGVLFSVALTGCGTDGETGTLSLRITDAPTTVPMLLE